MVLTMRHLSKTAQMPMLRLMHAGTVTHHFIGLAVPEKELNMQDQYNISYVPENANIRHSTQDQYKVSVMGEHAQNMNGGSHAFIADAAKINHRQVVGHKVIQETSKMEVREHHSAPPDVTKNFSRLPKIHWVPQPNNYGEPVVNTLYKKSGAKGLQKGGIQY
jgi:hypothetical protein